NRNFDRQYLSGSHPTGNNFGVCRNDYSVRKINQQGRIYLYPGSGREIFKKENALMEHHMLAILLAVVIDFMIGDPPTWPHPVRWIGSGIGYLEKRLNHGKHRKAKGFFMVLLIISIAFLTTLMLVSVFYQLHPVLGIVAEGLIIAFAIAQKGLKDAALAIYHPLRKGNMKQAREKLSYIVGRDTEHLDEKEIVRGTVETVAENTS